jgi:hypothetical protein
VDRARKAHGERMLKTKFWQQASKSLARPARRRHAGHLEDAERVDRVVEVIVDALRRVTHSH